MKTYDPSRVVVSLCEIRSDKWDMANYPVSGREYMYTVVDRNFPRLNNWQFVIRVPYTRCRDKNIQLQPLSVPAKKLWKNIEYRVITFLPTTHGKHKDKYYCKVFLSDVSGQKTKRGMTRGERNIMPPWLQKHYFRSLMRLKRTVARTRGSDCHSQVMIVKPDDHKLMIRIFFANKIWVLQEGYEKM